MKIPGHKLSQINSLLSGVDQFKSLVFSLSQNETIEEADRNRLTEYLEWMRHAPIKSFEYDWDSGKTKIFAEATVEYKNKKDTKDKLHEIWEYVSEYIPTKYFNGGAYRTAGHFIDQKLNQAKVYNQNSGEMTADNQDHVDFQVHKHDFTYIKLSPPEDKLIKAIMMLLHQKSVLNLESEHYYTGNGEVLLTEDDGYRLPHLKLRPIDLYKTYTGKEAKEISGAEITHVKKVLFELEKQMFKVTYRRVIKKEEKGKEKEIVQLVSMNKPLFKVISFLELTKEEEQLLEEGQESIRELKEELILALNPIFIDQIKTKYIEFPFNITKRIEEAAGGPKKVTEAMNLLVDYLLREKSSKRFRCEIDYDNLMLTIGLQRLVDRGEKSRARQKIEEAVKVAQSIGLLEQIDYLEGSKKQEKIIFHINSKFK